MLGVRFLYAEPDKTGQSSPPTLGVERLAALPAALIAELRQAVEGLDLDETQRIVERIREQDAALADLIQPHLDNYDFDPILRLVEALNQGAEPACPG